MAIFNPNNFKKMKTGREGEICIKGHNVAKYYHNLKKQNKKSFLKVGLEVVIMEKWTVGEIFIFQVEKTH